MNRRSPVTIVVLVGGLLLFALAALLGASSLFWGISTYPAHPCYGDVMRLAFSAGPGTVSLVVGVGGVIWCIGRIKALWTADLNGADLVDATMPDGRLLEADESAGKAETADLAPPERSTIPLGILQARIAAGQCPKCGSQEAPAAQNCQWCGIDLAWSREHLDELARNGRASLPEGTMHK